MLLREMNNFDEINNFFMNNYWNKIGNFAKHTGKVSMRWKKGSDFRVLHSTQLQEENWSKIETLSLNPQARFRSCRKKSIVWEIREIFKMLNQYAMDIPTLPVNLCFSHLSEILTESEAILSGRRAAKMGCQAFRKRFCKSRSVFFSIFSAGIE